MGLKKRRQETRSLSPSSSFRSSSYRRDSDSPATSAAREKTVNVGCMAGIFNLMSKYHTRRKFLTFGKKQERNAIIVQSPTLPPPLDKNPQSKQEHTVTCGPRDQSSTVGRLSLDHAPRSPAITPEIRRSSADNSTSLPRVVERLMGIDDFPATSPAPVPVMEVSTASEKRRKLLGALEKCDEDLKALKKIIEAVRATQTPPRLVKMERGEEVEEGESEVGSEGPSPVSVLDHQHHVSSGYSKRIIHDQLVQQHHNHKPKQQKQQMTRKKPGDHEDKAINFLNKPSSLSFVDNHTTAPQVVNTSTTPAATAAATAPWSNTAMKESVIEVCRDVEWGQTQEVGRIGLLLQDFILRELIDEIMKELICSSTFPVCSSTIIGSSFTLPFDACKRKLCF